MVERGEQLKRKDSLSALQDLWSEWTRSPKHSQNSDDAAATISNVRSGNQLSTKVRKYLDTPTQLKKVNSFLSDRSTRSENETDNERGNEKDTMKKNLKLTVIQNFKANLEDIESKNVSQELAGVLKPSPSRRTNNKKYRKSTSVVEDLRHERNRESYSTNRKRKGSDSSLMGAKTLILSALSAKEQKEKRLTAQLEKIEAEIRRTSIGGSKSKRSFRIRRSNSHTIATPPMSLSPLEPEVGFQTQIDDLEEEGKHVNDLNFEDYIADSLSDSEDTITSTGDDVEKLHHLETAHSKLMLEHCGLKGEILRMTGQLEWIEMQLQATKGHAKCLSKSTSDWAGMMKQIHQANTVQEQRRVLRQGTMALKHSSKKRGCGPRFIAFDAVNKVLFWSKTTVGAAEILKHINLSSDCTKRSYSLRSSSVDLSFALGPEDGGSGSTKLSNATCISTASISNVLNGEEVLNHIQHLKVPNSTIQVCQERPECMLVVQMKVESQAVVFEFFDPEVAESFALGLKLAFHDESFAVEDLHLDDHSSIAGVESMYSHLEEDLPSFPDMEPGMGNSAVAARLLYGAVQESSDMTSTSFRSDPGHFQVGKDGRRGSIRSLNSSFELKSLDCRRPSQSFKVSQLQRDLSQVRTRKSYLNVLVGSAARSQLVLPLQSGRAQRNISANHVQMLKDLKREKNLLLNAASHQLGSEENTQLLVECLKGLLKNTLRHLDDPDEEHLNEPETDSNNIGHEPTDDLVNYWCDEILLAASRTVIEGDVYSVCHKLLTGPNNVLLMPAYSNQSAVPIEIFVAPEGLVTIESESEYRVVHVDADEGIEEEWAKVHARCIEHLSLTTSMLTSSSGEEIDEKNIRSIRLEFEP